MKRKILWRFLHENSACSLMEKTETECLCHLQDREPPVPAFFSCWLAMEEPFYWHILSYFAGTTVDCQWTIWSLCKALHPIISAKSACNWLNFLWRMRALPILSSSYWSTEPGFECLMYTHLYLLSISKIANASSSVILSERARNPRKFSVKLLRSSFPEVKLRYLCCL